ncbi:hypothetical protein CL656_06715, partial [bacterium]|nr:hypothetical protein [bacterium]
HGQCIGCGGRDEFVDIIKNTRQELIIVEPTGLFDMSELHEISEIVSADFRSIYLLPGNKLESSLIGTENITSDFIKAIGLTHTNQIMHHETNLLEEVTKKSVYQFSQEISDNAIANIWSDLTTIESTNEDEHKGCSHSSHSHEHKGCSHSSHSHEHHHEGEPYCTSFFTEEISFSKVMAYLVSLGENLVRFKGVLENQNGEKIRVDWAHGTWTQRQEVSTAPFKADLFTVKPVEVNFQSITDQAINQLADGIPPVYTCIPDREYDLLDPVGSSAWSLLYEVSQGSSLEVKKSAGQNLAQRCIDSIEYLNSDRLNPELLENYKTQIAMFWSWWVYDFNLEINQAQKSQVESVIDQINPNQVDKESIQEWVWDEGPKFKDSLEALFPQKAKKILHLFD